VALVLRSPTDSRRFRLQAEEPVTGRASTGTQSASQLCNRGRGASDSAVRLRGTLDVVMGGTTWMHEPGRVDRRPQWRPSDVHLMTSA
jgi:hypothetical protein